MRRIQFSKSELDLLDDYLTKFINSVKSRFDAHYATDLSAALKGVKKEITSSYEHQCVYKSVQCNTLPRYWQIMYHTPLSEIPLYINNRDPVTVAIVQWRLSIAR